MSLIPYDYETPSVRYDQTVAQGRPSAEVIEAIESGVSQVTRRVEIYEADGHTPWRPNDSISRLINGAVTVDYNSPERRKLDLTLDNTDDLLRQSPTGFWYDKIIKAYRGVRYSTKSAFPTIAMVEAPSTAEASRMASILYRIGYTKLDTVLGTTGSDLGEHDWILSYTGSAVTAIASDLQVQFAQGKRIITISTANTNAHVPFYTAGTGRAAKSWTLTPVSTDTPTRGAFTTEASSPAVTGWGATATDAWATQLAVHGTGANPSDITATIATSANGGYWLDLRLPNANGSQAQALLRAALDYMRGFHEYRQWETQIGEFMIDGIADGRFPYQTKITGRDYTKKMMNSKLGRVTTFAANTYTLRQLVYAVAANSGIPDSKIKLGIGSEIITSEMSFDKGTPRWDIAFSACQSFGYELFFDGPGNLVARKFLDPTLSPIAMTFGTGEEGNLVSYDRATNDSRIFNHIIVESQPSDGADRLPYWAEAANRDPASPTNIDRIGDRVDTIEAPWLNSNDDCKALAKSRLKIAALESYELNFSSIYYPWLEAGEIVEVLDPKRNSTDPTRFLMDTLSLPLDLGPMSATGKRVTFVGDSGGS